jgi:hypothetical protein
MEFDWNNPPFDLDGSLTQREIEESFEDPFAIRLLPDSPRLACRRAFSTWECRRAASDFQRVSDEWKAGPGLARPRRLNRKNDFFTSGKWIRR